MSWKHVSQLCIAVIGVAGYCSFASAQAPMSSGIPRPPSVTEGYAGQELRQIYTQGIGRGFSGDSLNQIALQRARAQVPFVGQSTTRGGGDIGLGLGGAPAGKPFDAFSPAPTVSPYLNLFREDLGGTSDLNYQTLVRPQLQQQQFNQQVQRQALDTQRRLQQFGAQPAFPVRGTQAMMPTGHRTVFMNLGQYYPAAAARRR